MEEEIPGYIPYQPKSRYGTSGEFAAFRIVNEAMGIKIRYKNEGDIDYENIRGYKRQPPIRYEVFYNKIIRTVNTFQYLAQNLSLDNRCRYFEVLNRQLIKKNKGKNQRIVKGVDDEVWKIFRKRFHVGRLIRFDSQTSDLDIRLKWVKVTIMGRAYYLVCAQKTYEEGFTTWKMVTVKSNNGAKINHKIPIRLTQQEIIEKLEDWEIRKIGHYGNSKKFYTRTETLEILSKEYINLP